MIETIDEIIDFERSMGMICGSWEQHWLLAHRSPEHVKRWLRLAREQPGLVMTRQGFQGMDLNDANTAAFTARNNLSTELNVLGDTASGTCPQSILNQYCTIPANDARAGKVYNVRAVGIYSNTGTPTWTWTPRWGNSTTVATNISLGASVAFTTITSTTNLPWFVDFDVAVRTAPPGATLGTVYAGGFVKLGIPVTSSQLYTDLYIGGGTAATTVDTTGQGAAGCGITMNTTWSAASASNTSTCQIYYLSSRN